MFATAYAQKESVEIAGEIYAFDEVVRRMDSELYYEACEWAGAFATSDAILSEYQRLHLKRHKQPFAMPRR